MALTSISDFWQLKAHINHPEGGFSEGYNLPPGSSAAAIASSLRLLSFRADIMALGFSIVACSLSKFTVFKDNYNVQGYRSAPINLATEALITNVAPCNDREVGVLWRFDTGLGKFANRLVRGLRDSWITNNAASTQTFNPATLAATDAQAFAVANTTTQQQAIDRYLNAVFWYTRHIKVLTKTAFVDGLRTMTGEMRDWATVEYRKVSSHDIGAGFGSGRGRQAAWS